MWIAVLGRKDTPTDGVEDYCTFLSSSLKQRDVSLRQIRIDWIVKGWGRSLIELWRASATWRESWILIQYTALSWSRRGFPVALVFSLPIVRFRAKHCAVVFHEFPRQGTTTRWVDRVRRACQQWVIHELYKAADKGIFTVPLEAITWLPADWDKATFIPIGANIPEKLDRCLAPRPEEPKTVVVFGVTGGSEIKGEVEDIAFVMRETNKIVSQLRLVVIGRGSEEAQEFLHKAMEGCPVEVVVRGVLAAEEVAAEFRGADALLFVRGIITTQRGSAIAGIACGLPIIGYCDGEVRGPLAGAGIEFSQWRDRTGLVRSLVCVLTNPSRWMDLHERNVEVQRAYFSWNRIADRYWEELTE